MAKKVVSALPRLKPVQVILRETGEVVGFEDFKKRALLPLLDWVERDTERLYSENTDKTIEESLALKGSANSYSRNLGYKPSHMDLPREIKAKSRLGELVHHKLFSETAAYARNPNPRKREHKFSRTVNLGAVNAQMVTLERNDDQLFLTWKCWEEEYVLIFNIPDYILRRSPSKWSLPLVSSEGFTFTIQESPAPVKTGVVAGVDLGRVEPFTMAVLSKSGRASSEHKARPQVRATNNKRERILKEVKCTRAKKESYAALGLDENTLAQEIRRMRAKASRMGDSLANEVAANIARITSRTKVEILHVENLKWASGAKYGSKWNHGATIEKVEHTLARTGVKTNRVNPRGTSQHCFKCGGLINHNTRTRMALCALCKTEFDRDFNAAMNIALNQSYPSLTYGLAGSDCSHSRQVTGVGPLESQNATCLLC